MSNRSRQSSSGDREAMAKLSTHDLEKILFALTGIDGRHVQCGSQEVDRGGQGRPLEAPHTELTDKPMHEVLSYLRANDLKTYIVTGGGQDFVRVYSQRVMAFTWSRWSECSTKYSYDQEGKPILTKEPKLLLNDNDAGKPEGKRSCVYRLNRCGDRLARSSGAISAPGNSSPPPVGQIGSRLSVLIPLATAGVFPTPS